MSLFDWKRFSTSLNSLAAPALSCILRAALLPSVQAARVSIRNQQKQHVRKSACQRVEKIQGVAWNHEFEQASIDRCHTFFIESSLALRKHQITQGLEHRELNVSGQQLWVPTGL